jgi:hypothetical protein
VNLTLSLLVGLVVLLPGLTAVVAWNRLGNRYGAKGPELPLTAVSALFIAISVSVLIHVIGTLFGEIAVHVSDELQLEPLLTAPYPAVIEAAFGGQAPGALAPAIIEFLVVTLIECWAVVRIVLSPGLGLVLRDVDARNQGWAFEHVVRPHTYGYTPIAFVLTNMTHEEVGIGYQGPIVELRQTGDGKVGTIVLGQPERFVYEMKIAVTKSRFLPRAAEPPTLLIHARHWVGGAVALDMTVVRNIVVHNLSEDEIADGHHKRLAT